MKQIEDILKGIQTLKIEQIQHLPVSKICFDTRQVENNCVFVAQKGTKTDGHQFRKRFLRQHFISFYAREP